LVNYENDTLDRVILKDPMKLDSVVRTLTSAILAFVLIQTMVILAIWGQTPAIRLRATEAVIATALLVIGFYFGGHVAQNTAALEERRQNRSSSASHAAAERSEASAIRSERAATNKEG